MAEGDSAPLFEESELEESVFLYRRIHRRLGVDWTTIDAEGRPRIKGGAFQDYPENKALEMGYPGPCMSVAAGNILQELSKDPVELLDDWGEDYGLARLTVGDVRVDERQGVALRPTLEEPWHAVVFSRVGKKRTAGMESQLARAARWVVVPAQP